MTVYQAYCRDPSRDVTWLPTILCSYEALLQEERLTSQEVAAFERKLETWWSTQQSIAPGLGEPAPRTPVQTSVVITGGIYTVNAVLRKPWCLEVKDHLSKPQFVPIFPVKRVAVSCHLVFVRPRPIVAKLLGVRLLILQCVFSVGAMRSWDQSWNCWSHDGTVRVERSGEALKQTNKHKHEKHY